MCGLAASGQTLLTGAAFEEAQYAPPDAFVDTADLRWLGHGLYTLKGVDDALLIHEVGHAGEAPCVRRSMSTKRVTCATTTC